MESVTVEYTQEDINSLVALIDAGVKALGIQAAEAATHHVKKLEAAVAKAKVPSETEEGHA